SMEKPYSTRTAMEFYDAGLLEPLFVESRMREIDTLASDVLTYINSAEGANLLASGDDIKYSSIHPSKMPEDVRRLLRLHPEKLPGKINHIIRQGLSSKSTDEWFNVDERFVNFYMTLLATRLSERRGLGILTDTPASDRLANTAKLDGGLTILDLSSRRTRFGFPEYDEHALHQKHPATLAQGALANLVIKRIQIDPETSVEKILEFKRAHSDELGFFRNKIAELTSAISEEQHFESLMQRVNDIYTNEFKPGQNAFKKALKSSKVKWRAENFLKISCFSISTTSIPLALLGLSVPQVLLVGAGISLTASAVLYNYDKREKLNQSP